MAQISFWNGHSYCGVTRVIVNLGCELIDVLVINKGYIVQLRYARPIHHGVHTSRHPPGNASQHDMHGLVRGLQVIYVSW